MHTCTYHSNICKYYLYMYYTLLLDRVQKIYNNFSYLRMWLMKINMNVFCILSNNVRMILFDKLQLPTHNVLIINLSVYVHMCVCIHVCRYVHTYTDQSMHIANMTVLNANLICIVIIVANTTPCCYQQTSNGHTLRCRKSCSYLISCSNK